MHFGHPYHISCSKELWKTCHSNNYFYTSPAVLWDSAVSVYIVNFQYGVYILMNFSNAGIFAWFSMPSVHAQIAFVMDR